MSGPGVMEGVTAMVHDAWRRGRRTGLLEGLLVGVIVGAVAAALFGG